MASHAESTAPPCYWLVGNAQQTEFQACLAPLHQSADVRQLVDWDACRQLVSTGEAPTALLVLEGRPGEIPARDVEELRRVAPLLPIVAICGSWSEGALRSAKPWPASLRVYAHQPQRLAREVALQNQGQAPLWAMSLTNTEEERLLERAEAGSLAPLSGLAVVAARERATREMLGDLCRQRGLELAFWNDVAAWENRAAQVGFWDAERGLGEGLEDLARFAQALAPAPIVVFTGFPRVEQALAAAACGASLVISKPFWVADVWAGLAAVVAAGAAAPLRATT